jgi:hypothetical protein
MKHNVNYVNFVSVLNVSKIIQQHGPQWSVPSHHFLLLVRNPIQQQRTKVFRNGNQIMVVSVGNVLNVVIILRRMEDAIT